MQFGKSQKYCATCVYWTGYRELTPTRRYVKTDVNEKGYCRHPELAGSYYIPRRALFHCHKFESWNAILK